MPFRSSTDNSTVAAIELINTLKNPLPAAPFSHIGDMQMEALDQLADFFTEKQYNRHMNNNSPQYLKGWRQVQGCPKHYN